MTSLSEQIKTWRKAKASNLPDFVVDAIRVAEKWYAEEHKNLSSHSDDPKYAKIQDILNESDWGCHEEEVAKLTSAIVSAFAGHEVKFTVNSDDSNVPDLPDDLPAYGLFVHTDSYGSETIVLSGPSDADDPLFDGDEFTSEAGNLRPATAKEAVKFIRNTAQSYLLSWAGRLLWEGDDDEEEGDDLLDIDE